MFSKALFKQSCKANGTMWTIITFAVCLMLACVMLISGNGKIGETKNAVQDTIITQEIDSSLKKRALNYYLTDLDGLEEFDAQFAENATEAFVYSAKISAWEDQCPNAENYPSEEEFQTAYALWANAMPEPDSEVSSLYAGYYQNWASSQPERESFSSDEAYQAALNLWKGQHPAQNGGAIQAAYVLSCSQIQTYMLEYASNIDETYTPDSPEVQELLGTVLFALNPNGTFDEFYQNLGETVPEEYDILSLVSCIQSGEIETYLNGDERNAYRAIRSSSAASVFLSGNMTDDENVEKIVAELSSYGVTKEKYDRFGYTYDSIKYMSQNTILTYRSRIDYETEILDERLSAGEITEETYPIEWQKANRNLIGDITDSLLTSLPDEVSSALEEIGQLDLYSLIVGSIFYKLAGLLLPIIYMIMASNNLIVGQVDSGSMAYVLSTSTKRKTVVFTQGVYLIGSLFAMFGLTTVTGCICLSLVSADVRLTYGKLILLNLGAFLVLFALSGLCFLTSCVFDRSKRSMSIGGGLSIYALVAAMLGLFGSQAIPSVVRLDSLNAFNYTTIISLFDVISIIDGTSAFIGKLFVLLGLGIVGYLLGSWKFVRKDLPL